ncbi:MAG: hypothetical protein WBP41_10170 [Saprospiraceae bacterium]
MNRNVLRQIKDIQVQAERLISDNPEIGEIYVFGNYNKQLKSYLLANLKDEHILSYVIQIPEIDESISTPKAKTGVLTVILAAIAPWLLTYFRERNEIGHGQEIIRDIRGKYASVEFLMKNIGTDS